MAGSDIISALKAGSGFDTASIVDALVAAERAPKQSQIDRGIEQSDSKISAYGVVTSALQTLQTAFAGLKDSSDYQWFSINNPNTSDFTLTASVDAQPGAHSIQVNQLADKDMFASNAFSAADKKLNGENTLTLTVSAPDPTDVKVDDPTPERIVDALNDAGLGLTAQLFDTGLDPNPYQIVVSGELGADNAFTITSSSGDVSINTALGGGAQDALVTVDGLQFQRSSNEIADILDGVTLSLKTVMTGAEVFSIDRNTAPVEESIRNLVSVYNDVQTVFNTLKTPADDSEKELAGALSADSTFRSIRDQVRDMVTRVSTTPSGEVNYFSDIGVSITRSGTLQIDESTLATALSTNFSDVVSALSADTEDQSEFGTASRGLAGDASKQITDLISSSGPIRTVTDNAEAKSAQFAIELEDLDSRMEAIRARYVAQFAAMESLVDQMNSTREYLKTQLENLPFTNKKN